MVKHSNNIWHDNGEVKKDFAIQRQEGNPYARYFIKESLLESAELKHIPYSSYSYRVYLFRSEDVSNDHSEPTCFDKVQARAVIEDFLEFARYELLNEYDLKLIYDNLPILCIEKSQKKRILDNNQISERIKNNIKVRLDRLLDGKIDLFFQGFFRLIDGSPDTFNRLITSSEYFNIDFQSILEQVIASYVDSGEYQTHKKRLEQIKICQAELGLTDFKIQEIYFTQRLFHLFYSGTSCIYHQTKLLSISYMNDTVEKIERDLGKAAEDYDIPFDALYGAVIRRIVLLIQNDIENNLKKNYVEAYPVFKLMLTAIKHAGEKEVATEAKEEVISPFSHWKQALTEIITIAENAVAGNVSASKLTQFLNENSKRPRGSQFFEPEASDDEAVRKFCVGICQLTPILKFEKHDKSLHSVIPAKAH